MPSFTPGPWIADVSRPYRGIFVRTEDHAQVCEVLPMDGVENGVGTMAATAHLIAESPAMLEALEWALEQIVDDPDLDAQDALESARATVRRAKGE